MRGKASFLLWISLFILTFSVHPHPLQAWQDVTDDPTPPETPVKLIFIHHSTGGNWLADVGEHDYAGGLGRALMENNYFVSATNYGWGPDGIGDRTDIPNWIEWFLGDHHNSILEALYTEYGQNIGDFGQWSRLKKDPGGENQIIVFKSCFPNSDLYGSPDDPPADAPNDEYTVSNAKAVYNRLLTYFATRQDKLFVVITAPPLMESETSPDRAANARAFNNWLVQEWLKEYPHANVAVFDFFNVLTSSAGSPDTNDEGQERGNHHRWWQDQVQHVQAEANDFSAYYTDDSHPSSAGGRKAAAEFVPLLNVFYHRWQAAQARQVSPSPTTPTVSKRLPSSRVIAPSDLVYQGAFRLPDEGERPLTFAYGGAAMTYNPDGDTAGTADGFPGSLFIMGHDRLAYGELPNGNQVAEVDIPLPLISSTVNDLPQAGFIQPFHDVASGFFLNYDEIPRAGMQYLHHAATGAKIHLAWGQHLQPESVAALGSHAWFDPNLDAPHMQGVWFIGQQSPYSVSGYLFAIPPSWADQYTDGRYLAAGRFRDGGWSGMGPTLFAYRPWLDEAGTPAPDGTHLEEVTLLHYQSSERGDGIEHTLNGYQHPDEWEGGAWLLTPGGKSAVIFAGTKSVGAKYWYGYVNPAGPEYPCVDGDMVDQFITCRLADGSPCSPPDLIECTVHNDYRGWWSTALEAQIIFYDPDDLAKVAVGALQPWEPQPYAVLNLDPVLFHNPSGVELDMLGKGIQRRFRIGEVAYDQAHGLVYILELYADEAKPVVHVWKVRV